MTGVNPFAAFFFYGHLLKSNTQESPDDDVFMWAGVQTIEAQAG